MDDPVVARDVGRDDSGSVNHHLAIADFNVDALTVDGFGSPERNDLLGGDFATNDVVGQDSGECRFVLGL